MKKRIIITLSIITALIFTGIGVLYYFKNVKGDVNNLTRVLSFSNHIIYDNLEDLIKDSDLIIIGEPVNELIDDESVINYYSNQYIEKEYISTFYTLREVKVKKVIKGDLTDNYIYIGEIAAVVDNVLYIDDENSVANKNNKYIFFLSERDGVYFIKSINQGKFNIDGKDINEIKEVENKSTQYSSLKKAVMDYYKSDIENTVK